MMQILRLTFLWVTVTWGVVECGADEESYQFPLNATRSTVSGIAAYRSALTLDWLAGEDSRQRELVRAFETEGPPRPRARHTDCVAYPRPAAGGVARLMLELLKSLEGDEGVLIPELIGALVRAQLLVETAPLEAEPDLAALVRTPGAMRGQPHVTLPRLLAAAWTLAADPVTTKKSGWCAVKKLNQYLMLARPVDIAKQMRALDPVVARVRFIMEEFIQNVTPLNIYPDAAQPTPPTKLETSEKKKSKPVIRGSRGEPAAEAGASEEQQEYGRGGRLGGGAQAPRAEPLHDAPPGADEPPEPQPEPPEPQPERTHQHQALRTQPRHTSRARRVTPVCAMLIISTVIL